MSVYDSHTHFMAHSLKILIERDGKHFLISLFRSICFTLPCKRRDDNRGNCAYQVIGFN